MPPRDSRSYLAFLQPLEMHHMERKNKHVLYFTAAHMQTPFFSLDFPFPLASFSLLGFHQCGVVVIRKYYINFPPFHAQDAYLLIFGEHESTRECECFLASHVVVKRPCSHCYRKCVPFAYVIFLRAKGKHFWRGGCCYWLLSQGICIISPLFL